MFARLFAWIASMFRRHYVTKVAPIVTVPPPPGTVALIFNLAPNSQYVPVVSF